MGWFPNEGPPPFAKSFINQVREPWNIFDDDTADQCAHFFTNQDPLANVWTGGNAQVLYNTVDGLFTFPATMALLNIPPNVNTFAEPNVMPGKTVMHRFANIRDVMNIKIKQEY